MRQKNTQSEKDSNSRYAKENKRKTERDHLAESYLINDHLSNRSGGINKFSGNIIGLNLIGDLIGDGGVFRRTMIEEGLEVLIPISGFDRDTWLKIIRNEENPHSN